MAKAVLEITECGKFRTADDQRLDDSVEISDSANHAGVGISSSTVWLSLAWSYWEAPESDLGDIVNDALRDVDGDR